MNALNKYLIMRAKPDKPKPLRTMRDKRALDDILFRWMGLIAAILIVGLYGYEYLHHDDQPGLRMTTELRK